MLQYVLQALALSPAHVVDIQSGLVGVNIFRLKTLHSLGVVDRGLDMVQLCLSWLVPLRDKVYLDLNIWDATGLV